MLFMGRWLYPPAHLKDAIIMLTYLVLALVLWLVVPIVIGGHVKKKSDRKALILLCRILALVFAFLSISRAFLYL